MFKIFSSSNKIRFQFNPTRFFVKIDTYACFIKKLRSKYLNEAWKREVSLRLSHKNIKMETIKEEADNLWTLNFITSILFEKCWCLKRLLLKHGSKTQPSLIYFEIPNQKKTLKIVKCVLCKFTSHLDLNWICF